MTEDPLVTLAEVEEMEAIVRSFRAISVLPESEDEQSKTLLMHAAALCASYRRVVEALEECADPDAGAFPEMLQVHLNRPTQFYRPCPWCRAAAIVREVKGEP